jgi:hydrogenase maturation protease
MSRRALVAGIGNIFLGDDGFGVEVAARLSRERLPEDVRVLDAGIRARDLAYELLDGAYDTAILVDAMSRGGAAGTIYVIEPDAARIEDAAFVGAADGHAMNPQATLAFVQALGGVSTRIVIVGCEPANLDEGIGLSQPVAAAVDEAMTVVRELLCA